MYTSRTRAQQATTGGNATAGPSGTRRSASTPPPSDPSDGDDEDEEAGALEIGPLPRILYGLPSHFGSLLPPFQATRRRDVGHLETVESAARDGYNPRIIEVNIGGTKVDELA